MGEQHGEALFTNAKGKSRKGIWENGARKMWIGDDGKSLKSKKSLRSAGFETYSKVSSQL